jgi:hypothetical protein
MLFNPERDNQNLNQTCTEESGDCYCQSRGDQKSLDPIAEPPKYVEYSDPISDKVHYAPDIKEEYLRECGIEKCKEVPISYEKNCKKEDNNIIEQVAEALGYDTKEDLCSNVLDTTPDEICECNKRPVVNEDVQKCDCKKPHHHKCDKQEQLRPSNEINAQPQSNNDAIDILAKSVIIILEKLQTIEDILKKATENDK